MSHGRPPRTTVTKYAPSSCSATTTVTSTVSITTLSPKELKSFCSEIYSTMTCGQPTPRTTLSRTRSQHIVTPPALSLPTSPPSISSLIGETSERTMNSDSSVSLSSWSISGSKFSFAAFKYHVSHCAMLYLNQAHHQMQLHFLAAPLCYRLLPLLALIYQ